MTPANFRPAPPRKRSWLSGDDASVAAITQMLLIAGLIGATWLLAAAHLVPVARLAYLAGALAIAVFYIRRSPWLYLTAILWFWTLSPFVRRVVDYYGAFEAANLVLLAPNVVTLLMLGPILTSRELSRRLETGVGMLLLAPVFYGLSVSLVKGDMFAGAVASLDWFIPLLFYFYLIDLAPRIDEADAHLRAFVPLNLLIIVAYGFYQFYNAPAWDQKWVDTTSFAVVDFQAQVHLFSVLTGPGPCALWVGSLVLLSMHFRTRLSMLLMPPALIFLALSGVRASVGAVVLGLAVAAFFGERSVRRSLVGVIAAVAAATVLIAVLDPEATERVVVRFASVHDLQNDESAQARVELYRTAPTLIADYPLGLGIGALGKGARIGGGGDLSDFDSGMIAPFVAFGWLGGMIYLFGSFTVVAQACLAARRTRSPAASVLAIMALTCLASSFFAMFVGVQGLMIWFSAGYASAIGVKARISRPAASRPRRSLVGAQRDFSQNWSGGASANIAPEV